MEEILISDETMHCGLGHKQYHHNQGGDEQKFYAMWLELIWVRDSSTYGKTYSFVYYT